MARWACEDGPRTILDPAVGGGVFVEAVEALLAETSPQSAETSRGARAPCGTGVSPVDRPSELPSVEVCEIDGDLLDSFAGAPRALSVHARREDFIAACFDRPFDAIIANPPYIRHHDMTHGEEVFRRFDDLCRRRLSRMTNLYGLFLIKIWTLLADRGRAAIITPAEWLNADFGVALKGYLLEENAIDGIVHFDHAANIFAGALTTAAITLLRRGRRPTEAVRFLHVQDQAALADACIERGEAFDPGELDPKTKWTPLFTRDDEQSRDRKGAVTPRTGRPLELNGNRSLTVAALIGHGSRQGCLLGEIARCMRGIATGANDFFTLRESDRRRLGIDIEDLRPCISKAQDITDDVLTHDHFRRLVDADRRVYLLHPRTPPTPAVERYLTEGLRGGIERRYLPSHRPIWYMPEGRPPAPILVSVFARERFRFVLNEAGVLNLTAYHGIYPHSLDGEAIRALFAFLTGPEAQAALTRHRRVYGDGLLKVEPRDVEALPIPDDLHAALDRDSLFAGNLR